MDQKNYVNAPVLRINCLHTFFNGVNKATRSTLSWNAKHTEGVPTSQQVLVEDSACVCPKDNGPLPLSSEETLMACLTVICHLVFV